MRHAASLAVLGAGAVIATLVLTPSPDAITMLYYLMSFLGSVRGCVLAGSPVRADRLWQRWSRSRLNI